MRFALPVLSVFAAILSGQSGPGSGAVQGTVIDNVTKAPIRNARLMLIPQIMPRQQPRQMLSTGPRGDIRPSAAASDASGSFRVGGLQPGTYSVTVQHARYPLRPGVGEPQSVQVKDGETTQVTLGLDPGATVKGRIVDEDGDPISGCMVRLENASGNPVGVPGFGMEQSDEAGQYRIWGSSAGKYVAAAQCGRPVFQPRPFSAGPPAPPSVAYPTLYYPDAMEASAAQALELHWGEEKEGIDFRMKTARVVSVSGVVATADGSPLQNAMLELIRTDDRSGLNRRLARLNPATGDFQITQVFPGSYDLVGMSRSANMLEPVLGGRLRVDVTDKPLQLRMTLHRGADIAGSVVVESDGPVTLQQINLQLVQDGRMSTLPAPPPIHLSESGTFVIKGVLPGHWRVMIYGPNVFLKSVEFAGRRVEGSAFDFEPGASGPLQLVISNRMASVEGTAAPGRTYTILGADEDFQIGGRVYSSIAGPDGRLRWPNVPPGKYRVQSGGFSGTPGEAIQEFSVAEGGRAVLDLTKP